MTWWKRWPGGYRHSGLRQRSRGRWWEIRCALTTGSWWGSIHHFPIKFILQESSGANAWLFHRMATATCAVGDRRRGWNNASGRKAHGQWSLRALASSWALQVTAASKKFKKKVSLFNREFKVLSWMKNGGGPVNKKRGEPHRQSTHTHTHSSTSTANTRMHMCWKT